MSCIVAVRKGGKVVVAADSQLTGSSLKMLGREPKVVKLDGVVFGVVGGPRIADILRYLTKFAPLTSGWEGSLHEWVAVEIAEPLRETLAGRNALVDHSGIGHMQDDTTLLVVVRDQLFVIWPDFTVAGYDYPYMAIGAGAEVALGACHALYDCEDMDARWIARAAIKASCAFSNSVGEPITYTEAS